MASLSAKCLSCITAGLVFLTLISGMVLTSSVAFTIKEGYERTGEVTVDDITVTVPVSCGIDIDGALRADHFAIMNSGTFKENIGQTIFSIFCNDNNGFSVHAVGYSNNEFGNTDMIATVDHVLSPIYNISTGLATSGNTSSWAMKLIPLSGVAILSDEDGSFSDYHVVPNKYVKVATLDPNSGFTSSAAFGSTYRAYVAPKQPAGTYVGKVRYTIVHPASEVPLQPHDCDAGKICYWPNANGVVDSMGDQDAKMVDEVAFETDCNNADGYVDWNVWPTLTCLNNNDDTEITIPLTYTYNVQLWASNFKRPGYGFAGWSDKFDWVLNENDANGNGTGPNAGYHIYGPNQTITTPADKGLSLYAVWVESSDVFQEFYNSDCDRIGSGEVVALTDIRDDNTYAVAKLADGRCWMIENLRLGGSSAMNLTSADTAVTSNITLPASTNTFAGDWAAIQMSAKNILEDTSNMTNTDSEIYSYGNYYSWSAAIGEEIRSYSDNDSHYTSICPSGWHLPEGRRIFDNNNNEFWNLFRIVIGSDSDNYYGTPEAINASKLIRKYPNNFLYSGVLYGSSFYNRGRLGKYWTSTMISNNVTYHNNARSMSFGSSNYDLNSASVELGSGSSFKGDGYSVRCVVDGDRLR